MGIKFKCKQSGNIFEFQSEHDIKTMRTHPDYEQLVEPSEELKNIVVIPQVEETPVKRPYRKANKE